MNNNLIPEGFKDDVTFKVATEHQFKNIIVNYFQSNGYDLVKTPLVEFYNLNEHKNTFQLLSRKGQKLIIRDDITFQVARLSKTRLSKKKPPLRLCYYGEVVRKKGTMLRPERQFLQIGAECIGINSYFADVEMMELAYSSLNLVGIKDITIEISSRVFFDEFIKDIKNLIIKKELKRLIKIKNLKGICNLLDQKKQIYIKDLFSCTGIYRDKKKNLPKLSINSNTAKEVKNIQNIISHFSKSYKKVNIFLDLCEIDNKNYHSGIRFTFFANNVRGEIAKGGRYIINSSNSNSNSNSNDTGTGFTCYMDTILRASSIEIIDKKILIPFNTSKIKINDLIKKKYSIVKYHEIKEIFKSTAKKSRCQFYLYNNSVIKI